MVSEGLTGVLNGLWIAPEALQTSLQQGTLHRTVFAEAMSAVELSSVPLLCPLTTMTHDMTTTHPNNEVVRTCCM